MIKVKRTLLNISLSVNNCHLHQEIISKLKESNIFVNTRTGTVCDMNDSTLFDMSDYVDYKEMLNELLIKGTLILKYDEINKNYKNKPVMYPIGGMKREDD